MKKRIKCVQRSRMTDESSGTNLLPDHRADLSFIEASLVA